MILIPNVCCPIVSIKEGLSQPRTLCVFSPVRDQSVKLSLKTEKINMSVHQTFQSIQTQLLQKSRFNKQCGKILMCKTAQLLYQILQQFFYDKYFVEWPSAKSLSFLVHCFPFFKEHFAFTDSSPTNVFQMKQHTKRGKVRSPLVEVSFPVNTQCSLLSYSTKFPMQQQKEPYMVKGHKIAE